MGVFHPSLDPALVANLRPSLALDVLVESLAPGRPSAATGVPDFTLTMPLGAGGAGTPAEASVLYWLDSHWIDQDRTAPPGSCPVLDELSLIGSLNDQSVLVIDDARLFLTSTPDHLPQDHWPGMMDLTAALGSLSPAHRVWVINDMIILAPQRLDQQIRAYDRSAGINLGRTVQLARIGSYREAIRENVERLRSQGRAGFNSAFQADHRSETIFAYHLQRLGIRRVLDIGANRGQFARTLRQMGYQGEILSVEPQTGAHTALLEATRSDPFWCALPRQATGAQRGFVDLRIARNSVSSSLRAVHPNHVRADGTTAQVRRERVFVSRSGDLLQGHLMSGIEGLKIDVQGFEDQVLEGYRGWLGGVRLLQVELSMVECYEGAPDLFSLDRRIVEAFGFSRISLEPTYYDDVTGVVQQYDGLYFRPGPAVQADPPEWPVETRSAGPLRKVLEGLSPDCGLVLGADQVPDALKARPQGDWVLRMEGPVLCLPPAVLNDLSSQPDLLDGFNLEEPGWDIALALLALSRGHVFKQIGSAGLTPPQPGRVDATAFGQLVRRLAADPACHCPDLIAELAGPLGQDPDGIPARLG